MGETDSAPAETRGFPGSAKSAMLGVVWALRALGTVVAVRVVLSREGFAEARSRAREVRPRGGGATSGAVHGVVRGVWIASRVVPGARNCLVRSLAVYRLLVRGGRAPVLRIGVRTDDAFAAHAWVEVDGEVVTPEGPGFEDWHGFDRCIVGAGSTGGSDRPPTGT